MENYDYLNDYQKSRVDFLKTLGNVEVVDLETPEGAWIHFKSFEDFPFLKNRSWFYENGVILIAEEADRQYYIITIPPEKPNVPLSTNSKLILIAVIIVSSYLLLKYLT